MNNNTAYYALEKGKLLGPFLAGEKAPDTVSTDSLVWCNGMTEWKRLSDIPELKTMLANRTSDVPLPEANKKRSKKILLEIDLSGINNLIQISGNRIKRLSIWSRSTLTLLRSGLAKFL